MNDGIILYSTGCPKCRILKKKLDEKGVNYEVCSDTERMIGLGFTEVPVLEVKGEKYSFSEALKMLDSIGGNAKDGQNAQSDTGNP